MNQQVSSLDLPKKVIFNLHEHGCFLVKDVIDCVEHLAKLNVLNIAQWEKIINGPKTLTAMDLYKDEVLQKCILSYNKDLYQILKDVTYAGLLSEIVGLPGSGKTQLCFHLCVSAQLLNRCDKLKVSSIYISTNSNYSPHRIIEIGSEYIKKSKMSQSLNELDLNTLLDNIYCIKIRTGAELFAATEYLREYFVKYEVRLVVIDSLSHIIRQLDNSEKYLFTCRILKRFQSLSIIYKFALIITNDMTTKVCDAKTYLVPALGDTYWHLLNNRIILSKKSSYFNAKLVKCPFTKPVETDFIL